MNSERITITIETGNDAFQDAPDAEVARILRDLADRFEHQTCPGHKLYDGNGNVVGFCTITPERKA